MSKFMIISLSLGWKFPITTKEFLNSIFSPFSCIFLSFSLSPLFLASNLLISTLMEFSLASKFFLSRFKLSISFFSLFLHSLALTLFICSLFH